MQNPVLIENSTMQGIASAIRTKTNTNNTMLPSQMASLITNIQSGSSGIELPNDIHMGTFTLSENSTDAQTFEHGFDTTPSHVFVMVDGPTTKTTPFSILGGQLINGSGNVLRRNANGAMGAYVNTKPTIGETTITIPNISSSYYFRAGWTYRWIVWR